MQIKLDRQVRLIENKIYLLRKELDFENLSKMLLSKANKTEVAQDHKHHEFKLETID